MPSGTCHLGWPIWAIKTPTELPFTSSRLISEIRTLARVSANGQDVLAAFAQIPAVGRISDQCHVSLLELDLEGIDDRLWIGADA